MKIRRLSKKDEKQLTQLRINAFKTSRWFKTKDWSGLSWSESDQRSYVLGIEENGELIASSCFCKVFEKSVMEEKLCVKIDENVIFPALELGTAVVALEKRGHGLMNVIHYFAYKAAYETEDIHSIISTINEGVGRTGLKKEMGSELTKAEVTDVYHDKYEDITPAVLCVLKKGNFSLGISVSEKYCKHPIESFEIEEGMMRELVQYMYTPSAELLLTR